jgi:hypothetical protein
MAPLPSNLRRDLERTIIQAREIAEQGSREAIEALTVHEGKRGSHVTSDSDIALRNHLRAHARLIGDRRNSQSGAQAVHRLVQECAYEHWHRMIFARFLAENNLLVEPESQVAVSLEDVEELARDEQVDRWELAGQYAQQSLPAIFRPDDPLLQLTLSREIRLQLDALLDELPRESFLADDSLGWVYQFWQSAEKERVNKEGDKITGETLSAVTQLFTEHYMVLFLLHNTIGAWHAGKVLAERPELAALAKNENELREVLRLTEAGGYDFEYLRFVREPQKSEGEANGPWRPMGGTFDGWPTQAAELKVLDPCCGSGHFLVAAFELLVRLRMHEEGLSVEVAVDAVIQDNLFGLELDPRCTQIAAFNVAVAAWKLTDPRPLPPMKNIACTGISVGVPREQWMQALEADGTSNLRFYFGQLYDMFSNAAMLGSLINPNRFLGSQTLKEEDMQSLFASLETVIESDPSTSPEQHELGVASQGLARAAELLASRYHVVLTNVPYLGRGKQDESLKQYIDTYYKLGSADLATAFVLRCLEFCPDGVVSLVTPGNWLYLTKFEKLRVSLLERRTWLVAAKLGPGAFETITGHVVNVSLVVLRSAAPSTNNSITGIDVSELKTPGEKASAISGAPGKPLITVQQSAQFENPDARIIVEEATDALAQLSDFASVAQGLSTTDGPQFIVQFWELAEVTDGWEFLQTASRGNYFDGCSLALCWSGCNERYFRHIDRLRAENRIGGAWQAGRLAWGKDGFAINVTSTKHVSNYSGAKYDVTIGAVIPKDKNLAAAIYCYLSSPEYLDALRTLDPSLSVTEGSLLKVPFDEGYWDSVAKSQFPNGLPVPESDDPTQWLFHGRPEDSTSPIHVAVARLLGYRWPAELDSEIELSDRARGLVESCNELLPFIDEDGIACIPSVRSEDTASTRLTRLLEACNMKPPHQLDDWLRNDFFKEHCELFSGRQYQFPFIWHIWDGRKSDGFHALVNYHMLAGPNGHKLLENLTYSYLGDWINRQESDVKRGESGADGRLAAAKTLQERLIAILKGEPPYDIFVRWKPLHEQPIGWNPDINDGVRLNIRPFMAVDIPGGRKGAGILRWGPKAKWKKDRGKEPKRPRDEYPWFWGWDESTDFTGDDTFTGERWNDCHYTNEAKHKARENMESENS